MMQAVQSGLNVSDLGAMAMKYMGAYLMAVLGGKESGRQHKGQTHIHISTYTYILYNLLSNIVRSILKHMNLYMIQPCG